MLETAILLKIGVLTLAMAPLIIGNLRTGNTSNINNAILFVAGVVFAAAVPAAHGETLSWTAFAVSLVLAITCLAFAAFQIVPAGVAKTLIALIPWLTAEQFFITLAVGMGLAAILAKATQSKRAPVALPLWIGALAALFFASGS